MQILIPWKPVVVVWCMLAAVIWVAYVGYSVLEGKNPFAVAQHHSYDLHTRNNPGHKTHNASTQKRY